MSRPFLDGPHRIPACGHGEPAASKTDFAGFTTASVCFPAGVAGCFDATMPIESRRGVDCISAAGAPRRAAPDLSGPE
jgi:hypothetical protein